MEKSKLVPPKHLSNESKRWWKEVVSKYNFEGHGLKLLGLAAEALDEAERARKTLAAQGETVLDRYDVPKRHPAVTNKREATRTFVTLIKALGINEDGDEAKSSGPVQKELP